MTRRRSARPPFLAAVVVVLAILPMYLPVFWEQVGLFVFAAAIGAIGLTVLTGTAGQLSLAHPFFIAIGAYGYCYLAAPPSGGLSSGQTSLDGLGLSPPVALVVAVAVAGLAGLVFSPIASRVRGLYLGLASLALVFIGSHILLNAPSVTGGFYGRYATPFSLLGFDFGDANPPLSVLGVSFGRNERLWYLGLVLLVAAFAVARNVQRGRPGRALQTIRDNEIAASVMGVNIRRYKAAVFTMSSMYAGLAGVLLALAFQQVEPDYFSFSLGVTYIAMTVIGGLGSVAGATVGAAFVTALPLVLTHYSGQLGFLAAPGSNGVSAGDLSDYIYGAAVIAVLTVAPQGLSALVPGGRGRVAWPRKRHGSVAAAEVGSEVRSSAEPDGSLQ